MASYWQYASLILISTCVDFIVGNKIDASSSKKARKFYLVISLVVNLSMLGVFKYYNFFYESSVIAMSYFGFSIPPLYHQLLLPVGISFYTFQTMSYTIDLYRGEIDRERSFIKFAVFVSFFPQLVAGPIVRAKDFLPQLHKKIIIVSKQVQIGVWLIFLGLFKKIIIADLLGYLVVDDVFDNPSGYSSVDLLVSLYAYTFQIYCDFSGYSDIAIGIAFILGFKLPDNFNRPYIAQSPSDFWQRWHISLSSWLRDYLYISLGGNRGKAWFVARNLVLTMLLGGLWHGAAWNFVLWGLFHGLILIATRWVVVETKFNAKMVIKILANFHLVVFSWLLFRVSDMASFSDYIAGMLQFSLGSKISLLAYLILLFAFLIHFSPKILVHQKVRSIILGRPIIVQALFYAILIFLFVGASIDTANFIYFRF
tara:strand:- start:6339 stop:7613 length:1275 start_codon:yes stop_codon:yes gene_type:complete